MNAKHLQQLCVIAAVAASAPLLLGDLLLDTSAHGHASRVGPPKATPQVPRQTPRVRIPGQVPNVIDRVRTRIPGADLGESGNSNSGDPDSLLNDQDRVDAELDALIDAIFEAVNPIQAADRSILDEYLEAAARPENKDKSPDELMEEAVRTVVDRIYSDMDGADEISDAQLDFWSEASSDNIMGQMREGESPVLDSRPGGMSQQEWNAHLARREQIYQNEYEAELDKHPERRPEVRPLRDSNGDPFVAEARAAANLPFGGELGLGDTNSRREVSVTWSDPFSDRTSSTHVTRDTKVVIVNQNGQETGVKVTFRPFGNLSGQQPVVYGQDPTVDGKMVEYVNWSVTFNTNNQRTFGKD